MPLRKKKPVYRQDKSESPEERDALNGEELMQDDEQDGLDEDDVTYPHSYSSGHITATVNSSDLIKKLKALADALQSEEDDSGENSLMESYRNLFIHLSNKRFLDTTFITKSSSAMDVRLHLTRCLCLLLRACGTDIARHIVDAQPDGAVKLRDVLLFIFSSLKVLAEPNEPRFRYGVHLLELLDCSTDSSFLMVAMHTLLGIDKRLEEDDDKNEVKTNEKLFSTATRGLLKCALETIRLYEKTGKKDTTEESDVDEDRELNVVQSVCDVVSRVLDLSPAMDAAVLDPLFFHLVNPQKTNHPLAHRVVCDLMQKLQGESIDSIQMILTRAVQFGKMDEQFTMFGDQSFKIHDLILVLYNVNAPMVHGVLSCFINELTNEDGEKRELACKLVGRLLSRAAQGRSLPVEEHDALVNAYITRFHDPRPQIREAWAQNAAVLLIKLPQHRVILSKCLGKLMEDREEAVRKAAGKAVISAANENLDAVNDYLLKIACGRLRDKKQQTRAEFLNWLLSLHHNVYTNKERPTETDKDVLAVVESSFLSLASSSDMQLYDEKVCVEKSFAGRIFPHKVAAEQRMAILLDVYWRIEQHAANALGELMGRQVSTRKLLVEMLSLVSSSSKENGEEGGAGKEGLAHILSILTRIVGNAPEAVKRHQMEALKSLSNFVSREQGGFALLQQIVAPPAGYECDKVAAAMVDLLTRHEAYASGERATGDKTCTPNIRRILERVAPLVFDKAAVVELCRLVKKEVGEASVGNAVSRSRLPRTLALLRLVAENFRDCFVFSDQAMHMIADLLDTDDESVVAGVLRVVHGVMSQLRFDASQHSWASRLEDRIHAAMQLHPNSTRVAKYAILSLFRILNKDGSRPLSVKIMKEAIEHLSVDDEKCAAAMYSLMRVMNGFHSEVRERMSELIRDTVAQKIVLSSVRDSSADRFDDSKPLDASTMPPVVRAKVAGMKLMARYLVKGNTDDVDDRLAAKTLALLGDVMRAGGRVAEEKDEEGGGGRCGELEAAWLRATAASQLMRLAAVSKYSKMVRADQLHALATLVADDCECVRVHVASHLRKRLVRMELHVEYTSIYAMVALLDREAPGVEHFRSQQRVVLEQLLHRRWQVIRQESIRARGFVPYYQPEYCIAYAIHMLAHSDALKSSSDEVVLAQLRECIWYVLEPFAKNKDKTDFDFIHRTLQIIKESDDALTEGLSVVEKMAANKKMWALADLAISLIIHRVKLDIKMTRPKAALSPRFFVHVNKQGNLKSYAPAALLKDEEARQGRLPPAVKKRNTTNKNGSTRVGKSVLKKTSGKKKMPALEEESDEEREEEEASGSDEEPDEEEVVTARKKTRHTLSSKKQPAITNGSVKTNGKREKEEDMREEEEEDTVQHKASSRVRSAKKVSINSPALSPILATGQRPARGNAKMVASTPFARPAARGKRKREEEEEERDKQDDDEQEESESAEPTPEPEELPKRGRGRQSSKSQSKSPQKKMARKDEIEEKGEKSPSNSPKRASPKTRSVKKEEAPPVKRGRGRPRKSESSVEKAKEEEKKAKPAEAPPVKKRGRPRKV